VLSQLGHLDITGPGMTLDHADGFQRQSYTLLVTGVGDDQQQVVVAQVSDGSCPKCAIPTGAPSEHSSFRPLNNSRTDQDEFDN
jgi:hypothetical protein